jgi:hypothetical protein
MGFFFFRFLSNSSSLKGNEMVVVVMVRFTRKKKTSQEGIKWKSVEGKGSSRRRRLKRNKKNDWLLVLSLCIKYTAESVRYIVRRKKERDIFPNLMSLMFI